MSTLPTHNNFAMGAYIMKVNHEIRQQLIQKVQEVFSHTYPFLKIEFERTSRRPAAGIDNLPPATGEHIHDSAKTLLEKEIRLSDQLTVSDLEIGLSNLFGTAAQVYRKSGNSWLGTTMSRDWTLKQQNDHAKDIASELL
jgi:hypothetical protein